MYQILKIYEFSSQSGQQDITDFLFIINQLLSNNNSNSSENIFLATLIVKENFYSILKNFEKMMNYLNINEKWQQKNKGKNKRNNNYIIKYIATTKGKVQKILMQGMVNFYYINLIFVFNQHKPFISSMQLIYRLLLNAVVDLSLETDIYFSDQVLYAYLMDAANANNLCAIKILIEEHHISSIKILPVINRITNKIESFTMPILQLTNVKKYGLDRKSSDDYWKEVEYNFIYMFNSIDFSKIIIQLWQPQEIFRCAFKTTFMRALICLLQHQIFCESLFFTEEDLIMIAFSMVAIPDYTNIVNIILNKNNFLKTLNSNHEETLKKTQNYIDLLQGRFNSNSNFQDLDHLILKTSLDFSSYFFSKHMENNAISKLLMIVKFEQENLTQENQKLLNNNFAFQEEITVLNKKIENLQLLSLSKKHIESKKRYLTEKKIENLEKKYNFLINQNYKLLETLKVKVSTDNGSSLSLQQIPTRVKKKSISEQQSSKKLAEPNCGFLKAEELGLDSKLIKRRYSYYL